MILRLPLALALLLLLAGCSSAAKNRLQAYFEQIGPCEQNLADLQKELNRIATLPVPNRRPAYQQVASQLDEQIARMESLDVPREAEHYQAGLLELLALAQDFMRSSAEAVEADSQASARLAAERKSLSERWAAAVASLQTEQARLAEKYGLQFR